MSTSLRVEINGEVETVDVARAEALVLEQLGAELGPAVVLLARVWGAVAREDARRAAIITCPCGNCGDS